MEVTPKVMPLIYLHGDYNRRRRVQPQLPVVVGQRTKERGVTFGTALACALLTMQ